MSAELGLADDAEAWFALGSRHHEAGRYAASVSAWRRCLALQPTHVGALAGFGNLLAKLGRRVAAVPFYEAALRLQPDSAAQRLQLASLFIDLKWRDRAQTLLADRAHVAPDGQLEKSRLANDAAVATLRDSLATAGPFDWPQRLRRAEAFLALGDTASCQDLLVTLSAEEPVRLAPYEVRTRLILRQSGVTSALGYLQPLARKFGATPRYRLFLAGVLLEAGLVDEAQEALANMRDATPARDLYPLRLRAAIWRDDTAQACRLAQDWLASDDPTTQPAIFALAAARAAGRVDGLADIRQSPNATRIAIIQYWHNENIPADVANAMRSWDELHPGTPHRIFDDASARIFLHKNFKPKTVECFDAARHPAMRSDLFRLAYLAIHGGVYVDADEVCRQDMRPVFAALADSEFIGWLSNTTPPYLYNGFIAVRPGSLLMHGALDEAVRLLDGHTARGTRPDIWQTTGPGLLTRVVARHVAHSSDRVTLLTNAEYRQFSLTDQTLSYKRSASGDWRMS